MTVTVPVEIRIGLNADGTGLTLSPTVVSLASYARHDRAGVRLAGSGAVRTGVAARLHPPGDPLRYREGVEYRDMDALQQMADQLAGKPLVANHPVQTDAIPSGMLADGARGNVIGTVRSARVADGHIVVELEVTPEGQHFIDAGNHELSVGYEAHPDTDRFQRRIKVDHLAVVPVGRCGPECRLDHGHDAPAAPAALAASVPESASPREYTDTVGASRTDEFLPGTMPVNMPVPLSGPSQPSSPSPDQSRSKIGCTCSGGAGTTPSQAALDASPMPDSTLTAGTPVDSHADKKLNAAARHALPAKHFAVPSREALPIEDAGHVRAAMARFNQEHFTSAAEKKAAKHRIIARAHELGIDPSGFAKEHADDDIGGDGLSGGTMDSRGTTMDKRTDDRNDPDADVSSGGGEGRAQTGPDPGFAAPDIHAKLAAALNDLKTSTARADKAESERDLHKLDAYNARKDAAFEKERADRAEKERDEHKARADKLEAKMIDIADKTRFDHDQEFLSRVSTASSARADLLFNAGVLLGMTDAEGKRIDRSKMSDHDLKVAVIRHVDHEDGELDPSLVPGMYASALTRAARVAQSVANVRQTLHENRNAGVKAVEASSADVERAAQTQMTERAANAWRTQTTPSKN